MLKNSKFHYFTTKQRTKHDQYHFNDNKNYTDFKFKDVRDVRHTPWYETCNDPDYGLLSYQVPASENL